MVRINNNKKGQAAIEFLMTYGWMLLVVLIVGALIFSFVDFGSLLPNKVELSNNLRADPTGSVAYSKDAAAPNTNQVTVSFRYNGVKRVTIDGSTAGRIIREAGSGTCTSINITNSDTLESSDNASSVTFLNGHTGYMKFDCTSTPLLNGDNLVGTIQIDVADTKTGLKIPSSGPIRLQIIRG